MTAQVTIATMKLFIPIEFSTISHCEVTSLLAQTNREGRSNEGQSLMSLLWGRANNWATVEFCASQF